MSIFARIFRRSTLFSTGRDATGFGHIIVLTHSYAHVREVQCAEVSAEQSVKLSDSLVRVEISGAGVDIWELE